MSSYSQNNKRIVKNTLMLYFRMIFLMIISLYTTRVILNKLGVVDYGIYEAVGGFVAMFSMISTSLSGAISRYITFSLAKDNIERRRKIFSTSVYIQISICVLLAVICETFGIWFINNMMTIPANRLIAANWVFQLSVLTTIINWISIPYNSLIIAHEKMSVFAFIGIYEGFAKLSIALLLSFSPLDNLVFYSILLCFVSLSIRFIYGYYCNKYFSESKLVLTFDKSLIKEMFSFAGWNFIGTTSGVFRSQGINILFNIFCGPVVNAARGIAMQVNHAITLFSTNFTTAIGPQITKSYAIGDKATYESLVIKCSKFSFFILMILCIPIFIEGDFIINKWLTDTPEYTVDFVRVILLLTLIESYSRSLIFLLLATGDIKKYQIIIGGIQLLNFPIAYIMLKVGCDPVTTVSSVIIIAIICLFFRLILLKKMLNFPIVRFCKDVILKSVFVLIVSIGLIIPLKTLIGGDEGWTSFIFSIIIIEFVCIFSIYTLGLHKAERLFIMSYIVNFINKFKV